MIEDNNLELQETIENKEEIKVENNLVFDEETLAIQKQLNKIEFCKLEENGLLEDTTINTIKEFKRLMGLNDDRIDNNLKFIINEILEWNGIDDTRTFARIFNEWKSDN